MHAYGTNSPERTAVLIRLSPVAVTATILATLVMVKIGEWSGFSVPVWLQALVGGPSAAASLLWTYNWLNRSGWRNHWVRRLLGIKIPDLNGSWLVCGETSYVDSASPEVLSSKMTEWKATATIAQTWSTLSVHLNSRYSSSVSLSGTILIDQDGGYSSLVYEYLNTPKPSAASAMVIHRGLARLIVRDVENPAALGQKPGDVFLEGEYYTHPRDRGNYGTMRFMRRTAFNERDDPDDELTISNAPGSI